MFQRDAGISSKLMYFVNTGAILIYFVLIQLTLRYNNSFAGSSGKILSGTDIARYDALDVGRTYLPVDFTVGEVFKS